MDVLALRKRSKAMLGREYRLEIAAAIDACHGESFTTQSIASATGIFYPRVREDLQRLLQAGLIRISAAAREVQYEPVPTTYWEAAARLLMEATPTSSPT